MAEITEVAGSVALCVAGFVSLYLVRHRRTEASLQRVPVRVMERDDGAR